MHDLRQFQIVEAKADTGFELRTLQHIYNKYHNWNGHGSSSADDRPAM